MGEQSITKIRHQLAWTSVLLLRYQVFDIYQVFELSFLIHEYSQIVFSTKHLLILYCYASHMGIGPVNKVIYISKISKRSWLLTSKGTEHVTFRSFENYS